VPAISAGPIGADNRVVGRSQSKRGKGPLFRWFKPLLLGFVAALFGIAFAGLLALQTLIVGVNFGMAACLFACGVGLMAFVAVLAIHELGHLLVAWAAGFPVTHFTVGLLQLERDRGRIRARLNNAWFRPAAYVVLALPSNVDRPWRRAAAILGGPISNLFLGAACLAAACGVNPGPPPDVPAAARVGWRTAALLYPGDPATTHLNLVGFLSLGVGLGTLIPGSSAGLRTDGGQLLDLWRGNSANARPPLQSPNRES
jgi:hypothetical protein